MKWMLLLVIAALGPCPALAGCGDTDATYCSTTFMATGDCDGSHDLLALMKEPWEKQPIEILSVTVGLRVSGSTSEPYVFAGNSYDPDVMVLQIGTGSTTKRFARGHGFIFPGPQPGHPHVDLHIGCSSPAPMPPQLSFWSRLKRHLFGSSAAADVHVPPTRYEGWLVIDYELTH